MNVILDDGKWWVPFLTSVIVLIILGLAEYVASTNQKIHEKIWHKKGILKA